MPSVVEVGQASPLPTEAYLCSRSPSPTSNLNTAFHRSQPITTHYIGLTYFGSTAGLRELHLIQCTDQCGTTFGIAIWLNQPSVCVCVSVVRLSFDSNEGGNARTQTPTTKNYTPHLLRFGVVAGFIMARSAMGPTRPGAAALLITANPAPGKYA